MPARTPAVSPDQFATFGDLLKYLRRRAGLTQRELSIAVGYSDAMISRLEKNQRLPDIATLMARFLPALDLDHEPATTQRLLALGKDVRREDAPAPGLPPFKGLLHFDESDAELFFGREALTESMTARVMSTLAQPGALRFLAIVGASGSGKSSVLRAGLLNALRWQPQTAGWPAYVLTPTAHPLEALAASLLGDAQTPAARLELAERLGADRGALGATLRQQAGRANVAQTLVAVDQFEELFTLCRHDGERRAFVDNLLGAAAAPGGPGIMLLALRADFYAHCADYPALRTALAEQQEFIGAMTAGELRRAIEEPARRGRWELESGLVDVLLRDLGAEGDRPPEPGALPLLSHALLETWERRRGQTLTLSGYTAAGGVRGAIAETAEAVFHDQLAPEQRAIARDIFVRLTALGSDEAAPDTRRRVNLAELQGRAGAAGAVREVLTLLADARLITTEQDAAEVAHEALIREWPTLREWLADDREGLRLHRRLTETAQEWERAARDEGHLYRGARLAQALEWAEAHGDRLNTQERDFLTASQAAVEREAAEREAQRRRELEAAQRLAHTEAQAAQGMRRRALYLVGAVVVALAAALFANAQRQAAFANLAVSDAQRLAAESRTLLLEGRDAPTAALLALRSIGLHYTPQGDEALSIALQLDYPLHAYVGHEDQLWDAGFLPGDQVIFTTSSDEQGSIRLWDLATGQVLRSFDAEHGCLESKLSPDAKTLAAACWDGLAHIWDLDTGQELGRFEHLATENPRVRFSPDGSRLLTGGTGASARLWDVARGQLMREFSPADSELPAAVGIAFLPDGRQIVTGGRDGLLRLWDAATGAQLRTFAGHAAQVWGVDVSPDGQLILSSSPDGTARLWDIATGQELRQFAHGTTMSYEAAFSPDGQFALTGGFDNTVRVWAVQTGAEVRRFAHPATSTGLAFSSDGQHVLTTAWDQVARLWQIGPGAGLPHYPDLPSAPRNFGTLAPNGDQLAITTTGNGVTLLDARTGQALHQLAGHTGIIWDMAFSPDGRYLATTTEEDHSTRLWDTQTGQALWIDPDAGGESVAFSADGQRLFAAGELLEVSLYDVLTGQLLQKFSYPEVMLFGAYAPDGLTAATTLGGRAGVLLWDMTTGQVLRTIQPDAGDVMRAIVYSPDGRYLAAGGNTGTLYLWDVQSGAEVRRFVGHTDTVARALAFSPDGRYLASGSADRTVRIWEVATGKELRRLAGFVRQLASVVFTPDGRRLLVVDDAGTLQMTYVALQDAVADLCARQLRDFLDSEREQYNVTGIESTCPDNDTATTVRGMPDP